MPSAAPPLLRRCRRWLAGGSLAPGGGQPLREQPRRFTVAQTLVRGFYAFLLYRGVADLSTMSDLLQHPPLAPLWPVAWLGWTGGPLAIRVALAFFIGSALAGAFFAGSRAARLAAFLGVLECVALKNSYGKIGHSMHLAVVLAGVFTLLPAGWTRPAALAPRRVRQETLLVVWLAQTALLLAYTMSGLGKISGALYQLAAGQLNAFSPGAFGAHIAHRLVQTGSQSHLGDWIIHHPSLTWPLLPAAAVLETCALLAAFRPSLGRPVAALLIVFHVGTYFTMTISFPPNCLLLALFFFASPFEPLILGWQTILFDVPLARRTFALFQSDRGHADD